MSSAANIYQGGGQNKQALLSLVGSFYGYSTRHKLFILTVVLTGVLLMALTISTTAIQNSGQSSAANTNSLSNHNLSENAAAATTDNQSNSNSGQSVNSSSLDINLNSSTNNGQTSGSLTVNGESQPVSGGNINRTFTSDNGNTTINISVQNSSSSGGGQ